MKVCLALSGGAARGAYHLGVLAALEENDIEVVAISGSSIGAIIGASYASGVSPEEQLEIFRSKTFKKAFKFHSLRNGFLRIDKQKEILKELVPVERIEDMRIKLYVTTIDLYSGNIMRFDRGDAVSLCVASGAVVPLFKPVAYEGYHLADGGIMDNLPVEPLLQYGFPIFGVDLHPQQSGFTNSFSGIVKRTLFLLWRASVQRQISQCDLYITDEKLTGYSLFRLKKLQEMFDLGYEKTRLLTYY
ncbi:MAG TPA: patatin [Campylobacteraceae bacterium]|nr:patatin [Campylobacteraceae bacterium]HHD83764.1 patatin [Campylobacteraceae bacterium]